MKRPIDYIVTAGSLKPFSKADREAFDERYGEGEIVQTGAPELQRKLWAICTRVIKEHNELPWDSAEELVDALKRASGHVGVGQTLAGKPYQFARSMGEVSDFPAFFNKCVDALADYLHIDVKTLTALPANGQAGPSASPHPQVKSGGADPTSGIPADAREGSPGDSIPRNTPSSPGDQPSQTSRGPTTREGAAAKAAHAQAAARSEDYSPRACMDKFVDLGITKWDDEEDKIRMIDQIRVMWMKHIDDLGFVYKCAEVAIKLSKGQMNEPDARRLLAAQLPESNRPRDASGHIQRPE
jgi:hypothetical protein